MKTTFYFPIGRKAVASYDGGTALTQKKPNPIEDWA